MPVIMQKWLLPEYIEDMLPPEARHVERMRRGLLDLFRVHGYQLVIPPLLEYLPSLLTGTGHDMELKTFKLVDQLSGRLMGLRADITPQAARIDAHLLNRQGVTRLCYAGSVLHTLPRTLTHTREPLQIGAELFGHAGLESDVEIQQLMLKALRQVGIQTVHLDLGHVAIFRSLAKRAGIDGELEFELLRALQGKDVAGLEELTRDFQPALRQALLLLPQLYGGSEVLDRAQRELPDYPEIGRALAELRVLAPQLQPLVSSLCFDLADVRGYHYQSGMVFAAYAAGQPQAIALGGRYDEVGKAFGRARPATGFSMDLRVLAALSSAPPEAPGILAPHLADAALQEKIDALRARGEVVIVDLPGHEAHRAELACDRMLRQVNGVWEVVKA